MGNVNGRDEGDNAGGGAREGSAVEEDAAGKPDRVGRANSADSMGNTPPGSPGRSRSPLLFAPQMFQEPVYHFHPPQVPPLPPRPPPPWLQESWFSKSASSNSLWNAETLQDHLKDAREMLDILKAMKKELEAILVLKNSGDSFAEGDDDSVLQLSKGIREKRVCLGEQELLSLEAAKSLYMKIKEQFAALDVITSQGVSWEEKSEVMSLAQKVQKHKRNKQWKKKKRRRVGEMFRKEREMYDKIDEEADEWRTREIAKDIAKRKVKPVCLILQGDGSTTSEMW